MSNVRVGSARIDENGVDFVIALMIQLGLR